ncbi:hypothetical protein ARSEF4850_009682, partial [Beauveria asiatica]
MSFLEMRTKFIDKDRKRTRPTHQDFIVWQEVPLDGHNVQYEKGDFAKVARDKGGHGHFWIAQILDIGAIDKDDGFARVVWMYLPEELPKATVGGNPQGSGRQRFHGIHELIASNH